MLRRMFLKALGIGAVAPVMPVIGGVADTKDYAIPTWIKTSDRLPEFVDVNRPGEPECDYRWNRLEHWSDRVILCCPKIDFTLDNKPFVSSICRIGRLVHNRELAKAPYGTFWLLENPIRWFDMGAVFGWLPFPKTVDIELLWDEKRFYSEIRWHHYKNVLEESKNAVCGKEGIKYRIHTDFCERLKKMQLPK